MIHFNCLKCGKAFQLPNEHSGKDGYCSCGAIMRVPIARSMVPQRARLVDEGSLSTSEVRWLIGGTLFAILIVAPVTALIVTSKSDRRLDLGATSSAKANSNEAIVPPVTSASTPKREFGTFGDTGFYRSDHREDLKQLPSLRGFTEREKDHIITEAEKFDAAVKDLERRRGR